MNEYLYKETDNLSALITAQPQLLLTLSHFGIPMGFGDKTIAQVCAENGVNPQFFLLICEVYSNDNYVPSPAKLRATPMEGLVPYLLRSHDYYLNRRLPHIGHHLEKIADMLPPRAGKAIKQFFNAYIEEVREHFAHEEKIVYPHIKRLLNRENCDKFTIKSYLDTHDNLEEKLSDLVQIIFKYLPSSSHKEGFHTPPLSPSILEGELPLSPSHGDDDAIDMIFDILQLSHDLRKHAIIEDKILGPYVKQLEKSAKP
ncbi:MAG: hemerythrin domain-containing protein [Muribaculaceae bacterium]|nr:hemerythrin domain-containing protein [Muribaculaceae bacterium]